MVELLGRDLFGKGDDYLGYAINEGMTEYFAHKLFSKLKYSKISTSYLGCVSIIKELIDLYGENTIIDAWVNGPDKLEELMKKDNKCFTELLEISTDYYKIVYCGPKKKGDKKVKDREAIEGYNKIKKFIKDIKQNRKINSSNKVSINDKSSKLNWKDRIKSIYNIVKSKLGFKVEEEMLSLNSGGDSINPNPVDDSFKNNLRVSSLADSINNPKDKNKENDKEIDKEIER